MTIQDIKLKHPKTCNHCAAFLCSMGGARMQRCSLGYHTEKVSLGKGRIWKKYNTWEDLFVNIKPAEPCPKPTNIQQCMDIRRTGLDIDRYSNPNSPEYKEEMKGSRNMTEEEAKHHYINLQRD